MKLIVGLGNPGEKYEGTRHNLGFMVLDEYVRKNLESSSVWKNEEKFKAEILQVNNGLWLAKPQTHMNGSGFSVAKLANYFKIPSENVIVIHDDLDILLGKIKIREGGSAAGHHGVESIIQELKDDKFIRVRLGIGSLHAKQPDAERFVLETFGTDEKARTKQMIRHAVVALELLLDQGMEAAQNQYN